MSSMSIVESERAIAEAEVVSKLTHLALFFIPLSLVAGLFGMNINVSCWDICDPLPGPRRRFVYDGSANTCTAYMHSASTNIQTAQEFEDKLTWWYWMLGSVVASVTTYAMLYRAELLSWMRMLPSTARGLSIQCLNRLAVRWLSIVNSIAESLPVAIVLLLFFGIIAGISVGTWKLASSELSIAAKASIAVLVIWLPFLFGLLSGGAVYLRNRAKPRSFQWQVPSEGPRLNSAEVEALNEGMREMYNW